MKRPSSRAIPASAKPQQGPAMKKIKSIALNQDQKRALEYMQTGMHCLTDANGNIEYSDHQALLERLIKSPEIDATTEVLKMFEPSETKKKLTERGLAKMVEDCTAGKFGRRGWQAISRGPPNGLMVWDVASVIGKQMNMARVLYSGVDAYRICTRLLPELVQCVQSCGVSLHSVAHLVNFHIRECILEKMCSLDLNGAKGDKFGTARRDLQRSRNMCGKNGCDALQELSEEKIWDKLLAMIK